MCVLSPALCPNQTKNYKIVKNKTTVLNTLCIVFLLVQRLIFTRLVKEGLLVRLSVCSNLI